MIEKNEDSNQSYKDASAGYNRSYLFYWGGRGMDQPGITNYNKLYESDTSGYLKSELGSYLGTLTFRQILLPGQVGLYLIGTGRLTLKY